MGEIILWTKGKAKIYPYKDVDGITINDGVSIREVFNKNSLENKEGGGY